MKVRSVLFVACLAAGASALAQGRDNFMQQQAYAEMQRVSGQVDVLQNNLGDLQRRIGALEGGGDTRGIRQEIEALKSSVAELRRAVQNQREEIVRDLSARIAKMQQAPASSSRSAAERRTVVGPHLEYTVQAGDTLSLIAQAFNTSVSKIKEMNNLKGDYLRIGQKLNLPK